MNNKHASWLARFVNVNSEVMWNVLQLTLCLLDLRG